MGTSGSGSARISAQNAGLVKERRGQGFNEELFTSPNGVTHVHGFDVDEVMPMGDMGSKTVLDNIGRSAITRPVARTLQSD